MKQYSFGTCIRSLRTQKHMTQVQLAEKLGVTDKAVSKWERDRSYPDVSLLPKLADELGTTVNNLLRECGEDCRPSKLLKAFEVSRDIRSPLHIMLGFVEIAKQNHDDPVMLMRYLEGIRISGEYLMLLLDRVVQEICCEGDKACREGYSIDHGQLEKYLQEQMDAVFDREENFDFSGKRILIADDVEVNREIAVEVLKKTGAATETAEDGTICLQKVEEKPAGYYDLILMDIVMPHMDGLEATRRIRQLPDRKKAEIPIIAMTSNVSENDRAAAQEAGMNAFAEKPIFVEKLFTAMSEFLTGVSG